MLDVNVFKRQGDFTVDAAFTAENTGITALFGHSGAGKSSVINMVGGLSTPDAGRIEVAGRVLFDAGAGINVPVHRRRLGYVFQDARLLPHMSVRSNLCYGASNVPKGEAYTTLDEVVSVLGVEHLLERRPAGLSGGEKQRVAIGRALLCSPHIMLMDEPLASLDTGRKNELIPYISRLAKTFHVPILYVTHAVDEILRLADRAVIMDGGRIRAAGAVEDVFTGHTGEGEPASVMAANVARVDDDGVAELSFAGGTFYVGRSNLPERADVRVRVSASDVVLATSRPSGLSVRNVFSGVVTSVEPAHGGAGVFVELDIGCPLYARISRRAKDELGIAVGMTVHALIKAAAVNRGSSPRGG